MEAILAFGLLIGLILGGMWVQFVVAGASLTCIWLLKGFGGWKALCLVSWRPANSFALAAMSTVALPELSAGGHDRRLVAGSLAAGGTLASSSRRRSQ